MNKRMFILALMFCLSAKANPILLLSNDGLIQVKQTLDSESKSLFKISLAATERAEFLYPEFLDQEGDILKFYIQIEKFSFWGSKNEIHLYIHNLKNNTLLFNQVFNILKVSNNDTFVWSKTNIVGEGFGLYQERYFILDFVNKFYRKVTPLVEGCCYYVEGMTGGVRQHRGLITSSSDVRGSVFIDIPYIDKSNKFLNYGYKDLIYDSINHRLVYVFWNQAENYTKEKKSQLCDVRSYSFNSKSVTVLLTDACRPSISNDGKNLLFERKYKVKGYKKLINEGFFILDSQSGNLIKLGEYRDAIFIKN